MILPLLGGGRSRVSALQTPSVRRHSGCRAFGVRSSSFTRLGMAIRRKPPEGGTPNGAVPQCCVRSHSTDCPSLDDLSHLIPTLAHKSTASLSTTHGGKTVSFRAGLDTHPTKWTAKLVSLPGKLRMAVGKKSSVGKVIGRCVRVVGG